LKFKSKTEILVLGAGISGCAAAQELQARGADYLLLEKNAEPGGLTRSINVGEGHFDYTGHFLHLARCKSPAEIPYGKQKDEDWQLVQRRSVAFAAGRAVPAPLQYNLYALPERIREKCLRDFENRPQMISPSSFREYLISGFGEGICDLFLTPYNEKLLATSLEDLTPDASNRFFPKPDVKIVRKGFLKPKKVEPIGYSSYFWYPRRFGIGLLAKGMSDGLSSLRTCCPAERLELSRKLVHTPSGAVRYERLISSLPLKFLCRISDHPKLKQLSDLLSHNKVLCLNILLKGRFNKNFDGCHWIYIPDKNIPFYRLGIYSHLPVAFVPAWHSSLYIEIGFGMEAPLPSLDGIIRKVFSSLEKLRWASRKDCRVISANWIDCAYVHFTPGRREVLPEIMAILREKDIHPIGRYGLWDYTSMEDSIYSGVETARKLL
jgi:protoporphyrinogen oxidase